MTSLPATPMQSILEDLSRDVWERLRDVRNISPFRKIRFGEETLTDIALLDLNRKGIRRALFIQTTKAQEAISGTDFECWLGLGQNRWLRLAIQAKKLDLDTDRYNGFAYRVGSNMQIDLLERFAHRHNAIPLYCLYNFSNYANEPSHWHCCQKPFEVEQLGCTVTTSSNIRSSINRRGARKFDYVHKYQNTIPWRCLAICPRIESLLASRFPQTRSDVQIDDPDMQPRIYADIPPRLRREIETDQGAKERIPIRTDELDPEYYDQSVGIPRRVLVWESQESDDPLNDDPPTPR